MNMLLYQLIGLLLLQSPANPTTADEVMQRVRQATQISKDKIPETGLQLTGKGSYAGMPATYQLLFNRAGHFVQKSEARIITAVGYDGSSVWVQDLGGEQRIQELTDRNKSITAGLFATSLWIDASSGFSYTMDPGQPKEGVYTLKYKHPATDSAGIIRIDAKTWLPLDCSMQAEGRVVTRSMSEVIEFNGMKFPRKFSSKSASDSVDNFVIENIQQAPTFVRNPYTPLIGKPADVSFDNSFPAELEVKRANTGHLLVKAMINGKDVGWFIFDSGAGAHCLDNGVIKELGLEQFGELPAIGVGGSVKTKFSRPETMTLGRATLKNPVCVGLDLGFLSGPMGAKIAGVVGYGAFHRCIVEMDMYKSTISVYDPQGYDQARVENRWQKLYQAGRVSCVDAEFEGHKGVFKLDTGAAGSNVAIHAPIVEKFKLLDGRATEDTMVGGVGGMVKAKKGKLQYFEIGGHRMENVEAEFATTKQGAFNSSDTLGNIGGELVKPFRMVFDYQNKRIAFVKRVD